MRGGSLPLLGWASMLAVMLILNWVWTGDAIQIGEFGFAVGLIAAWGAAVLVRSPDQALRTGPPPPRTEIESLPQASMGAAGAAVGFAAIVFGLVWASFLVFFGAGLMIASLGRVAAELRAERATRGAARGGTG